MVEILVFHVLVFISKLEYRKKRVPKVHYLLDFMYLPYSFMQNNESLENTERLWSHKLSACIVFMAT